MRRFVVAGGLLLALTFSALISPTAAQDEPDTQDGASFTSTGIGLSQQDWESRVGPADQRGDKTLTYLDEGMIVTLAGNGNLAGIAWYPASPISKIEDARKAARALLPKDVIFVVTVAGGIADTTDYFVSPDLIRRFDKDDPVWGPAEPGVCEVGYFLTDDGSVKIINIVVGS